jgi:hypothetical protein
MQNIDEVQVVMYSQRRAMLETALAQRMYSVFDSPPLIGQLRDFVCQAVEHLAVLATRAAPAGIADANRVNLEKGLIASLLQGERFLNVWNNWSGGQGATPGGLVQIVNNWQRWSAADCSDLIRLYCTVMENPALRTTGLVGGGVAEHQQSTRPGGAPWDKGPGGDRRREGAGANIPAGLYHPHTDAGRTAIRHSAWEGGKGGVSRFRLLPESNVRLIDAVFGLPEGADISGTTADSIFFAESVNSFFEEVQQYRSFDANWLPVVQLLPLATMVSHAHHTLLESALTLTLNSYITYSIGFYTTLMPAWASWTNTTVTLGKWLLWAEDHDWNYHMLCYYHEGRLCGYLFGRDDNRLIVLERFKRLATTGIPFLNYFRTWPCMPRQIHVDTLRAAYGL